LAFEVSGKIWVNNHAHVIRPVPSVHITYLAECLESLDYSEYNTGTAQPKLTKKTCSAIPIPLPPLPEQRAIADALSDVDALIERLDALIAKKRAIKTATMQRLLTGQQRLPGFSAPWTTKRLGEIAEICTGKKDNQDKVDGGPYPFFVRSENVERIDTYSFDGEAILVPGEGRIGDIFHYVDGKFDYHQRVYKVSDFSAEVSGKYVYNYMSQHFGEHAMRNSVKATVDSLRLPTFEKFEIRTPSLDEQEAIATILADMDAEIEVLQARRDKTQAIKQGMMQELLTGRTRLV
jgi:type I restriction enzyme S subunit